MTPRQRYRKRYLDYQRSERGKQVYRKSRTKWNKNNKEKLHYEQKLNSLLFNSGITNDEFHCAICRKQPIEKHHEDHTLWFSFIPLCRDHHAQVTILEKNGGNKNGRL